MFADHTEAMISAIVPLRMGERFAPAHGIGDAVRRGVLPRDLGNSGPSGSTLGQYALYSAFNTETTMAFFPGALGAPRRFSSTPRSAGRSFTSWQGSSA